MNKVILMGNLTRDPEIRYSQGENSLAIARFGIAVNRRFARQGDTDTDFLDVYKRQVQESALVSDPELHRHLFHLQISSDQI